jgi:hypothetical protein
VRGVQASVSPDEIAFGIVKHYVLWFEPLKPTK